MMTADEILAQDWQSHQAPFEVARSWLRSGDLNRLNDAIKILEDLRKKFPEVLDIGPELILALMEHPEDQVKDRATEVLREELEAHPNARDSEEYLSRSGRLFRDRADSYVCLNDPSQDKDPQLALRYYGLALKRYQEAYELRHGHYPGINVANLQLVIDAVTSPDERRPEGRLASVAMARLLLQRRRSWLFELGDDNIWHLATEGDCHLLLQEWDQARRYYDLARKEKGHQPFHTRSIRRNVQRTCDCYRRIDPACDLGTFQDLDTIFSSPST